MLVEHFTRVRLGNRLPAFPRDVEDDERDHETDDRVGKLEADCDDGGAGQDAEADEAVDACVFAVCDERWALQAVAGA